MSGRAYCTECETQHDIQSRDHGRQDSYKFAAVPARHARPKECTGEAWIAKQQAQHQRLGQGFLVAMLGDRGTGKTQFGVELIRQMIRKHVTQENPEANASLARYVLAVEIYMAIKEAYRQDGPTERAQIEQFLTPRLLVIDDVHEGGDTPWEDRMFTYILDKRYGAMRDTLLLSNAKQDAFRESVGPSVYSRLTETGGIIHCDWASYRR